ncbi:hypothetical protein EDEG_03922 [Edhazardia aedis USNM 41457]|uniref:Uncharacterized protein n=1 Tax=Edhazardia aedis (strain USNM 41457) TaxID=1003232 RepID=J8ZP61_EDHAE|nr:hypothetical protein EDEG_03922 [Edhazardia aedis USNM 41457]|eukprot:EJW01498.1 hypothetical protein EDEG_03922 [Edhazardia aedis USNM 41457]
MKFTLMNIIYQFLTSNRIKTTISFLFFIKGNLTADIDENEETNIHLKNELWFTYKNLHLNYISLCNNIMLEINRAQFNVMHIDEIFNKLINSESLFVCNCIEAQHKNQIYEEDNFACHYPEEALFRNSIGNKNENFQTNSSSSSSTQLMQPSVDKISNRKQDVYSNIGLQYSDFKTEYHDTLHVSNEHIEGSQTNDSVIVNPSDTTCSSIVRVIRIALKDNQCTCEIVRKYNISAAKIKEQSELVIPGILDKINYFLHHCQSTIINSENLESTKDQIKSILKNYKSYNNGFYQIYTGKISNNEKLLNNMNEKKKKELTEKLKKSKEKSNIYENFTFYSFQLIKTVDAYLKNDATRKNLHINTENINSLINKINEKCRRRIFKDYKKFSDFRDTHMQEIGKISEVYKDFFDQNQSLDLLKNEISTNNAKKNNSLMDMTRSENSNLDKTCSYEIFVHTMLSKLDKYNFTTEIKSFDSIISQLSQELSEEMSCINQRSLKTLAIDSQQKYSHNSLIIKIHETCVQKKKKIYIYNVLNNKLKYLITEKISDNRKFQLAKFTCIDDSKINNILNTEFIRFYEYLFEVIIKAEDNSLKILENMLQNIKNFCAIKKNAPVNQTQTKNGIKQCVSTLFSSNENAKQNSRNYLDNTVNLYTCDNRQREKNNLNKLLEAYSLILNDYVKTMFLLSKKYIQYFYLLLNGINGIVDNFILDRNITYENCQIQEIENELHESIQFKNKKLINIANYIVLLFENIDKTEIALQGDKKLDNTEINFSGNNGSEIHDFSYIKNSSQECLIPNERISSIKKFQSFLKKITIKNQHKMEECDNTNAEYFQMFKEIEGLFLSNKRKLNYTIYEVYILVNICLKYNVTFSEKIDAKLFDSLEKKFREIGTKICTRLELVKNIHDIYTTNELLQFYKTFEQFIKESLFKIESLSDALNMIQKNIQNPKSSIYQSAKRKN